MVTMRRLGLLLLIVTACAGGISCHRGSVPPLPPGVRALQGAGATFPFPLYEKWIREYQVSHSNVRIEYDDVGSGEGVRRFVAEDVDFGASDTGMSPQEIAAVRRGVRLVPATAGAIVLAYNLEGLDGELRLSRDAYVDIFLGRITHWNDPRIRRTNPEFKLPKTPISVVARLDSSGTTSAFTLHLSAVSPLWKEGPGEGRVTDWPGATMVANKNEGVAAVVQRTNGGIGYVEYGIARRAGLKMSLLENRAGKFVAPTGASGMATLANNELGPDLRIPDPGGDDSYPIVTYTFLMLYERYPDGPTAAAVKDFVRWCLSDGQQYNEERGYIRLPPGPAAGCCGPRNGRLGRGAVGRATRPARFLPTHGKAGVCLAARPSPWDEAQSPGNGAPGPTRLTGFAGTPAGSRQGSDPRASRPRASGRWAMEGAAEPRRHTPCRWSRRFGITPFEDSAFEDGHATVGSFGKQPRQGSSFGGSVQACI